MKTPNYVMFSRGGGSGGGGSRGLGYGAWNLRKHPVKTFDAMLKTFGLGGNKQRSVKSKITGPRISVNLKNLQLGTRPQRQRGKVKRKSKKR